MTMTDPIIERLQERRSDLLNQARTLLDRASTEQRQLNDTETTEHAATVDTIAQIDERIAELTEERRSMAAADEARRFTVNTDRAGGAHVTREASVYRPGGDHSYLLDLAKRQFMGDSSAAERLARHGLEQRDLNRTDGTGGEFVPPAYLLDEFMAVARAGRVTADLVNRLPLPAGTDSINIPGLATGTATAIQSTDNAAVQETDPTDRNVNLPVRTIAGQVDVAIQVLEQSPVAADRILFADLLADYAQKLDTAILTTATWGLLNTAGINSTTFTDTTPTPGELYPKLADAINNVSINRYLPPTAIVMHPRRWAWFLSALDSQNRPLIVPTAGGNQSVNGIGTSSGLVGNGPVGTLVGLPVYVDPNIPTNRGAGLNEDVIIILRGNDVYLFESSPKTRVLPEVGSGTLTVRLQVYGYFAFSAARFPKSVSVISGTGLTTPVW